eukprot:CAMPEP_0206427768 /NCGR_PEP_ID=MMETSP0324_2-20121206/5242_1 /ASSEMBLY_ACC=CAM_ASM_000836 /TAXON_ID=2866 /ORGANISM="Crypthecodinium cohnii, Strain Seligo" /LENGTH=611 /DNA_ID=CAMNT_0053893121 /DNA_START=301 /DNA_END=2133 /DNA_ORIENTATION=-
MKYFEAHLANVSDSDDVDISVHCDVNTFEWLAEYMTNPRKVESLDANSVVSVLISSEFLQMPHLVEACVAYLESSLNRVLRLPIDLSCLSTSVARALASRLSDVAMEDLKDRRGKLLGRLYAHKLQDLPLFLLFGSLHSEAVVSSHLPRSDDIGRLSWQHGSSAHTGPHLRGQRLHQTQPRSVEAVLARTLLENLGPRPNAQVQHLQLELHWLADRQLPPTLVAPSFDPSTQAFASALACCNQSVVRFGRACGQLRGRAFVSRHTGCTKRGHCPDPVLSDPAVVDKVQRFRELITIPEERNVSCTQTKSDQDQQQAISPTPNPGNESDGEPGDEENDSDIDEDVHPAAPELSRGYCFVPLPEYLAGQTGNREVFAPGTAANKKVTTTLPQSFRGTSRQRLYARPGPTGRSAGFSDYSGSRSPALVTTFRRGRPIRVVRQRPSSATSTGPNLAASTANASQPGPDPKTIPDNVAGGRFWPQPPPEGARTFFNMGLPQSMSNQKKQEYLSDWLQEDERRRQDELSNRLHAYWETSQHRLNAPSAGLQQRRALAWLTDAATAGAALSGQADTVKRSQSQSGTSAWNSAPTRQNSGSALVFRGSQCRTRPSSASL